MYQYLLLVGHEAMVLVLGQYVAIVICWRLQAFVVEATPVGDV